MSLRGPWNLGDWDTRDYYAWAGDYDRWFLYSWYYITEVVGRMLNVYADISVVSGGNGGPLGYIGSSLQLITYQTSPVYTNHAIQHSDGDVPCTSGNNWAFGGYCPSGVGCYYKMNGSPAGYLYYNHAPLDGGTSFASIWPYGGSPYAYGVWYGMKLYWKSGSMSPRFQRVKLGGAETIKKLWAKVGGSWTQVARLVERGELDWKREADVLYVAGDGTRPIRLLGRWDYDDPQYLGRGYPGDPAGEMPGHEWRGGLWVPKREPVYRLRAA